MRADGSAAPGAQLLPLIAVLDRGRCQIGNQSHAGDWNLSFFVLSALIKGSYLWKSCEEAEGRICPIHPLI